MIPEGDDTNELFGWIMPRFKDYSVNRSYFSWLTKNKEYALDARVKGGRRNMIMSGEYDSVLPMDILGEYLIKAIIVGDIDKWRHWVYTKSLLKILLCLNLLILQNWNFKI